MIAPEPPTRGEALAARIERAVAEAGLDPDAIPDHDALLDGDPFGRALAFGGDVTIRDVVATCLINAAARLRAQARGTPRALTRARDHARSYANDLESIRRAR